jgi:hypothetical protein
VAINKLYFSHKHYKFDNRQSSKLDYRNLQKIINSTNDVNCHTSVSDVTAANIELVVKNAKEIVVIAIDFTNLETDVGILLNAIVSTTAKVTFEDCKNFDAYAVNRLCQMRPTEEPVLWVAGCSITDGYGVDESERYGKLLSNRLNLSEVLLAKCGSSILYSADQLLRSDIRAGDIVVWGLTNLSRIEVWENSDFKSRTVCTYDTLDKSHQYWNLDYFESPTQVLISIRMILQVVNFCKKIGARLYLANLLDLTWIPIMFGKYNNFINFARSAESEIRVIHIDLGTDNQHPGPKQHQHYADSIFNLIEGNKHGKTI